MRIAALTVTQAAINMVHAKYKGTGSKSHSFVLIRVTALLFVRGRKYFATYPPVLCSVLLSS